MLLLTETKKLTFLSSENIRLKQIENQVENVNEKLDSLTASSQDKGQF